MSTFVLVHGAWHGGWIWDRVGDLLRRGGHEVHAPDLPGHGHDSTPVQQVTLERYVERVLDVIDHSRKPVVLVGHSMGGMVISQAGERRPEAIQKLVYVCAFLLPDGQTLLQWAEPDREALVLPNLVLADDERSATLKPSVLREVFYADCSDEDFQRAKSLLAPQATEPLAAPLRTTAANFGRIPRVYIECLNDRAISIAIQRQMHRAVGCEQVFTLACSHSPFFTAPEKLVECMVAAVEMRGKPAL